MLRRLVAIVSWRVNTSPEIVEDACSFAWEQFMRYQPDRNRGLARVARQRGGAAGDQASPFRGGARLDGRADGGGRVAPRAGRSAVGQSRTGPRRSKPYASSPRS